MRSLSHAELQRVVERRHPWHQRSRRADQWALLSTGQRILVLQAEAGALEYGQALLATRRARDERMREGAE